jgi:hypothetical protein
MRELTISISEVRIPYEQFFLMQDLLMSTLRTFLAFERWSSYSQDISVIKLPQDISLKTGI